MSEKTKLVSAYVELHRSYEFWYEVPEEMSDKEAQQLANKYAQEENLDDYNPIGEEIEIW